MTAYGFVEETDYISLSNYGNQTGRGGQNKIDHIFKLDMAKEIAMVQRSDKRKQASQYFLQIEKEWNSPEKVMARALKLANTMLELKDNTIKVQEQLIG